MASAPAEVKLADFANLPLELRLLIWQAALPSHDWPAIFICKGAYFKSPHKTVPEEGSDTDNEDPSLVDPGLIAEPGFYLTTLDHEIIAVPLVWVNREARGVALAWARENKVHAWSMHNERSIIFRRAFDPEMDSLLLRRRMDPGLVSNGPNFLRLVSPFYTCSIFNVSRLRKVILPESELRNRYYYGPFSAINHWLHSVIEVSVLINEPQDLPLDVCDNLSGVCRRRWQLERKDATDFVWNRRRDTFELGNDPQDILLSKELKVLSDTLARTHGREFNVHPVIATKKW